MDVEARDGEAGAGQERWKGLTFCVIALMHRSLQTGYPLHHFHASVPFVLLLDPAAALYCTDQPL